MSEGKFGLTGDYDHAPMDRAWSEGAGERVPQSHLNQQQFSGQSIDSGYPHLGREAIDKAAIAGLHSGSNKAAASLDAWNASYDKLYPRPKDAVNVTAPGA